MHPRLGLTVFLVSLVSCRSAAPAPRTDLGEHPPSPVRVAFEAESAKFAAATEEYQRLWSVEHERIVSTMEAVSRLRFDSPPYADTAIRAVVFEGISFSGHREVPMKLRASYPTNTKRATLVHELGHRLQTGVAPRGEDEHEVLFLWLYDVWVRLYGRQFADSQVAVERARGGPYPRAWSAALSLTVSERQAKFHRMVEASQQP